MIKTPAGLITMLQEDLVMFCHRIEDLFASAYSKINKEKACMIKFAKKLDKNVSSVE